MEKKVEIELNDIIHGKVNFILPSSFDSLNTQLCLQFLVSKQCS